MSPVIERPDTWKETGVECFQVSRKDRKIVKAWRGKPGETGQAMTVVAPAAGGGPPPGKNAITGKVSIEKLTIAGKETTCEKVELREHWKDDEGNTGVVTTIRWYNPEEPRCLFARYRRNKSPTAGDDAVQWEGDKPARKGREVLLTVATSEVGKSLFAFIGSGSDAKPTLIVK